MDKIQAADLVAGMLHRKGIPFQTFEDGAAHRVIWGTTAVNLRFDTWGEEVVVALTAIAAEKFDALDDAGRRAVLEKLNEHHTKARFVRFVLYDKVVMVEADLIADNLQAEELETVLRAVGIAADAADEELKELTGGKTWKEVEDEAAGGQQVVEN